MITDIKNIDEGIRHFFQSGSSGTGEEEMLRIASMYSRQITAPQIKLILFLEWKAQEYSLKTDKNFLEISKKLENFIKRWLELKQYNNSASFVMRALESISLRRFINEDSMKVNVSKNA